MSDDDGKNLPDETSVIREKLVNTAKIFLDNPDVANRPKDAKIRFLKQKGLTDEEISFAFEMSNVSQKNISNVVPYVHQYPVWQRFRDTSSTIIFLAGIAYGCYYIYKKYIKPHFVKEENELQIIMDAQKSISVVMKDVSNTMANIQEEIKKQNSLLEEITKSQRKIDVSEDLGTIKSLLINRKSFPAVPASFKIPDWQKVTSDEVTSDNAIENSSDQNTTETNPCHVKLENAMSLGSSDESDGIVMNGDATCANNASSSNECKIEDKNDEDSSESFTSIPDKVAISQEGDSSINNDAALSNNIV